MVNGMQFIAVGLHVLRHIAFFYVAKLHPVAEAELIKAKGRSLSLHLKLQ